MKFLIAFLALFALTACETTQPVAKTQGKTVPMEFGKRPKTEEPNAAYKEANRPLRTPTAIGRYFQRY